MSRTNDYSVKDETREEFTCLDAIVWGAKVPPPGAAPRHPSPAYVANACVEASRWTFITEEEAKKYDPLCGSPSVRKTVGEFTELWEAHLDAVMKNYASGYTLDKAAKLERALKLVAMPPNLIRNHLHSLRLRSPQ